MTDISSANVPQYVRGASSSQTPTPNRKHARLGFTGGHDAEISGALSLLDPNRGHRGSDGLKPRRVVNALRAHTHNAKIKPTMRD